MAKKHVVAIDDEEHILELISYNLEANGVSVSTYTSVEEALEHLQDKAIDLILLDIMLPGMDGISALNMFKNKPETKQVPILLVSAKSEELDKILGLELGADDYITKPFSVRELVARVKVALRREDRKQEDSTSKLSQLQIGELVLDEESHQVTFNEELVQLSYKEFELLRLFMSHPGKVFSREQLLDKIWGYDYYGESRTVDVHVRYLRSKLEAYGIQDYIETVRGVGYKLIKE